MSLLHHAAPGASRGSTSPFGSVAVAQASGLRSPQTPGVSRGATSPFGSVAVAQGSGLRSPQVPPFGSLSARQSLGGLRSPQVPPFGSLSARQSLGGLRSPQVPASISFGPPSRGSTNVPRRLVTSPLSPGQGATMSSRATISCPRPRVEASAVNMRSTIPARGQLPLQFRGSSVMSGPRQPLVQYAGNSPNSSPSRSPLLASSACGRSPVAADKGLASTRGCAGPAISCQESARGSPGCLSPKNNTPTFPANHPAGPAGRTLHLCPASGRSASPVVMQTQPPVVGSTAALARVIPPCEPVATPPSEQLPAAAPVARDVPVVPKIRNFLSPALVLPTRPATTVVAPAARPCDHELVADTCSSSPTAAASPDVPLLSFTPTPEMPPLLSPVRRQVARQWIRSAGKARLENLVLFPEVYEQVCCTMFRITALEDGGCLPWAKARILGMDLCVRLGMLEFVESVFRAAFLAVDEDGDGKLNEVQFAQLFEIYLRLSLGCIREKDLLRGSTSTLQWAANTSANSSAAVSPISSTRGPLSPMISSMDPDSWEVLRSHDKFLSLRSNIEEDRSLQFATDSSTEAPSSCRMASERTEVAFEAPQDATSLLVASGEIGGPDRHSKQEDVLRDCPARPALPEAAESSLVPSAAAFGLMMLFFV